jgi:transcriptional regulator with XRE-family HTH domain
MDTDIHVAGDQLPRVSIRQDTIAFAAGMRMARAALGWSQRDLARQLGMTQRSVHRIEQARCEPRRATLLAIESVLRKAGLEIQYGFEGGLAINVPAPALQRRELAAVD